MIDRDLYICSFVSRTEKIMNVICLVELIGCTMHICLLGYYCIMVWKFFRNRGEARVASDGGYPWTLEFFSEFLKTKRHVETMGLKRVST